MSRIYDSSHLTQRNADKAISNSFNTNGCTYPYQSYTNIKDSSILNSVKNGQMTQYSRLPGCIEISPGCPCASLNTSNPSSLTNLPGVVSGINFTVGSISISWNHPSTDNGPFTYTITPYCNGVIQSQIITASTSYIFTNIKPWDIYYFNICAQNSNGTGPIITTLQFIAPPEELSSILLGISYPIDINPSFTYIINNVLDMILQSCAVRNYGPTISSRLMYLLVCSIAHAWNWVRLDTNISGIHDQLNWDMKSSTNLSNNDSIIWICKMIDYITPILFPQLLYISIYNYSSIDVTRIQTSGEWSSWIALWNTWISYRQNDNYAIASTSQPTTSANWNQTLIVDGNTINNISDFPQPLQWTRLTVGGKKQNYLTYLWNNVVSSCLTAQDELDIQNTVTPVTGSDRDIEIDNVLNISQNLSDIQKIQAEFWAGSGIGVMSPPHMSIWLWKEYVRSINTTSSVLIYSLLDLSIHMFEGGIITWGLKSLYFQDRPIQEIRKRYNGTTLTSWNGIIDGSQWVPYQHSNFVTPPFADFPSGHSHFMKGFSLTMTKWFGTNIIKNNIIYDNISLMSPIFSTYQTGVYGDFVISKGTSQIQPGITPTRPITFSFTIWDDIANAAGLSRLYGGIHNMNSHTSSQITAIYVDGYINSTWNILINIPYMSSYQPTSTQQNSNPTIMDLLIISNPQS